MDGIPTMSQVIMIVVGLLFAASSGMALFILKGILDNLVSIKDVQKDFEKVITEILVKMSAMQEQIKTLFMNDEDLESDIESIKMSRGAKRK